MASTLIALHPNSNEQSFGDSEFHKATRNKCIASRNKCLTSSNKCIYHMLKGSSSNSDISAQSASTSLAAPQTKSSQFGHKPMGSVYSKKAVKKCRGLVWPSRVCEEKNLGRIVSFPKIKNESIMRVRNTCPLVANTL